MDPKKILVALASAFAFAAAAPVFADKPSWAGKGKGHEERDDDDDQGRGKGKHKEKKEKHGKHFDDHKRVVVREYYQVEYEGKGKCPPGLAKKHNGCMPPGQAKKWQMGRPLPREVVYYPVPPELEVRIGLPPAGYKYVRVASDILMIAVGTGVVADAIQDLGRI
jgi:Ni/Co efflux regulator RcnB